MCEEEEDAGKYADAAADDDATKTLDASVPGTWLPMTNGVTTTLRAGWGFADDDVYAVGANGTILHYDGTSWAKEESGAPKSSLRAVYGTWPSNVWALGRATRRTVTPTR